MSTGSQNASDFVRSWDGMPHGAHRELSWLGSRRGFRGGACGGGGHGFTSQSFRCDHPT